MNYTNYERAIVEHYSVALDNWPLPGTVKNPSKVGGRGQVQILLDALKSDTCKWITLAESEIAKRKEENQARGEQVYIPRKARARKSQNASKETIDTEEESSASSSSSDKGSSSDEE
ncbi:hypothetical protein M405DRAFT_750690 [Rhizopogon salebrosus TDB-379]|nr:hypothetical protein M405DRAFT_750690 [Rhizopogon salebrosus TDB-379]